MDEEAQEGFKEVADSDQGPSVEDYLPEDVKDHPLLQAKKGSLNTIGRGIQDAEIAGGAPETLARKRAKQTVSVVSNSILHPKPPSPETSDENRALLKNMLESWLDEDEKK